MVNLPAQITGAAGVHISGLLLANGPGTAVVLADQGSAVPALAVWYKAQMPGGDFYTGVARRACKQTTRGGHKRDSNHPVPTTHPPHGQNLLSLP